MQNNRLSSEKSPYLKQHADNPVLWYPWGPEAFEKAFKDNKPIFLSIGYSTCHWCHVMAHESFEDQSTADILNQYFISIKVDREERPEIDHIYMKAVMAIGGHGGWPLSVFLKPDGKPFYGGTYFPPFAKWGTPAFKDVLFSIHNAWTHNQSGIAASSEELVMILRQSMTASKSTADLNTGVLNQAVTNLSAVYDQTHGGFNAAPKFPMGHTLSFLLSMHHGNSPTLHMVEHTLLTMASRGIHDQLSSGFHRYATDDHWQVPHFEKMLYDQALLAMAYGQCYQKTRNPQYASVLRSILDYVLAEMTSPEGAFYCAYDADSDGHEGAYYVFTAQEITAQLGVPTAKVFCQYFGVQEGGNVEYDPHGEFTGQNILYQANNIEPEHVLLIHQAKEKLLSYRRSRQALHLDDKILTDWNGLMITAFAFAGCVLGEPKYIEKAKRSADLMVEHFKKTGVLHHCWNSDTPSVTGILDDYAYLCLGLIAVYEATLEEQYLVQAESLARQMIVSFEDPYNGGFFMVSEATDLIVRPIDIDDGAMPSGNSVAAHVLLRLFFITDNEYYHATVKKLFNRFQPLIDKAPQGYTCYLQALKMLTEGAVQVTITGSVTPQELENIQKIVYKCYIPNLTVKLSRSDTPWNVTVCRNGVCAIPVNDLEGIKGQLTW